MTQLELKAARNYIERGYQILKMAGCEQADDIKSEIKQLDATIKETAQ